jgi:hydroxyacylglutathione hydrolase
VRRSTGISESAMTTHESGDVLRVGEIDITLIHTPGHTPGSQCFLVDGKLISGDTLFLDGCGRTDLPGSNPEDMYYSLTQRLAQVSNDTTLYPGHRYSAAPSAEMGQVRQENWVFDLSTLESFRATFG